MKKKGEGRLSGRKRRRRRKGRVPTQQGGSKGEERWGPFAIACQGEFRQETSSSSILLSLSAVAAVAICLQKRNLWPKEDEDEEEAVPKFREKETYKRKTKEDTRRKKKSVLQSAFLFLLAVWLAGCESDLKKDPFAREGENN